MKKRKTLFPISLGALILFCSASCSIADMRYRELKKILPDVEYGYTVFTGSGFVQDCTPYSLKQLIYKAYKKDCEYICDYTTYGDSMYIIGQYGHRTNTDTVEGESSSYGTYDLAIFQMDWKTLQITEQIYDFKDVAALFNSETRYNPYPPLGNIISEDRAVMRYNGALHILDLQQKDLIYSLDISDKYEETLVYIGYESRRGDYYLHTGDSLCYYEYKKDFFVSHEYKTTTKSCGDIGRLDDYVYTCSYDYRNREYVYHDCFNLTTDERVPVETLKELLAKEEERYSQDTYVLQGNTYSIYAYHQDYLEISDGENMVKIDEAFMLERSPKFVELYDAWTMLHDEYKIVDWTVVEEKLFVGFSAPYGLVGYTPTYIFEYDPQNDGIYYVGFSTGQGIGSLELHKK